MSIASRTPEGEPNRCPICGAEVKIEPSRPSGDAPCPNCGALLWFPHDRHVLGVVESLQRFRSPDDTYYSEMPLEDLVSLFWFHAVTGEGSGAASELMIRGLQQQGSPEPLFEVLRSSDVWLRYRAFLALCRIYPQHQFALRAMLESLMHDSSEIRDAAIETIKNLLSRP